MKIGISQPCFLPWEGYFALVDHVEKFVILDEVQFEKRSWQQRNYIKLNNNPFLISIPTDTKNKFHQKINEVVIHNLDFKKKILLNIYHAYKKKKYFDLYYPKIKEIFEKNETKLIKLNLDLIFLIIKILGIKTEILFQSKLKAIGKKEELIFNICREIKCSKYICTVGSKKYLSKFEIIPEINCPIIYFEYISKKKLNDKFFLSIIDIIFDYGENSIHMIRENFKIKSK